MVKKKTSSDWNKGNKIDSYQKSRTWSFKIPKKFPLKDSSKTCDVSARDLTGDEGMGLTQAFSPSIHDPIAAFNYKSQAARQQKAIEALNSGLDFVRKPESGAEYYEFCSARAPGGSWRVNRVVEDVTETILELTSNCTSGELDYKVLNWEIYQQPSYSIIVTRLTTPQSTWVESSTIQVYGWRQLPNTGLTGQFFLTELPPTGGTFDFTPGAGNDGIAFSFAVRNSTKLRPSGNPFLVSDYYWDTAYFSIEVTAAEIPVVEIDLLYQAI